MQFAACQSRFQHVPGIHRTFGLTRADHGVQFVDKQDNPSFLSGDVIQYRLESFFEFTAEFRTGDQRCHVQGQETFVANPLGHLCVDNTLGQPLDNRGLANPWFADQDRVVLGPSLQNLNRSPDFIIPSHHRI